MKTILKRFSAVLMTAALLFTVFSCNSPDGTEENPENETPEVPEETTPEAVAPSISVKNNTVTITTTTKDAKIYYTIDGTDPTAESTAYAEPFAITKTVTVKAFAAAEGFVNSKITTKECAYVTPKTEKPAIELSDNKVTITSATEEAVIYYTTDGTAPTAESTKYEAAFDISATVTVKALATKEGYDNSEIAEEECVYVAPGTVATPAITVENNKVTIKCSSSGAEIYYTTDGSAPTASSTKYTDAFNITATVTVKAIAIKGETSSEVASKECAYVEPEPETNEYTYSISAFPISIPANGETNYQKVFENVITDDLKKGDKVIITFEGVSDTELSDFKAFIVDNAKDTKTETQDEYGWNVISNYALIAETVEAKKDFEFNITLEVTSDPIGTGAGSRKLVMFYSKDVGTEAKIYEKGTDIDSIDTSEVVVFDPASYTGSVGTVVEIGGKKYLKFTPDGYNTFFSLGNIDLKGKTTFEATMFAESNQAKNATCQYAVDLKGSDEGVIAEIGMYKPIPEIPTKYTAAHFETVNWATASETDICKGLSPKVQDGTSYAAQSDVTVYLGKIIAK